MGLGQPIVQIERFGGGWRCFRQDLPRKRAFVERQRNIGFRQPGPGQRITWVSSDCLLQLADRILGPGFVSDGAIPRLQIQLVRRGDNGPVSLTPSAATTESETSSSSAKRSPTGRS